MLVAACPTTEWHIKENWNILYCICFRKYSRTPLIQTLVIQISLALRVILLRTIEDYLALKLLDIGSSTVVLWLLVL
jgi:hypothetical protein